MKSFEIHSGDPNSWVILHVPHSSRLIPSDVRTDLLLDDSEIEKELDEITDTLTDSIALRAIANLENGYPKPSIFRNTISRLVIDPERFPDNREPMNQIGMGAVYRKGSTGMTLRSEDFNDEKLLEEFFYPYAEKFTELVDEILSTHGKVVIIDVHSYRPKAHLNSLNQEQRRPEMCIGTDTFHTPDYLVGIFREVFGSHGNCVENEPYAGTYVPLKHYGRNREVHSIMMETRSDTFLDDHLLPHDGFDRVVKSLSEVLVRVHDAGRL